MGNCGFVCVYTRSVLALILLYSKTTFSVLISLLLVHITIHIQHTIRPFLLSVRKLISFGFLNVFFAVNHWISLDLIQS